MHAQQGADVAAPPGEGDRVVEVSYLVEVLFQPIASRTPPTATSVSYSPHFSSMCPNK